MYPSNVCDSQSNPSVFSPRLGLKFRDPLDAEHRRVDGEQGDRDRHARDVTSGGPDQEGGHAALLESGLCGEQSPGRQTPAPTGMSAGRMTKVDLESATYLEGLETYFEIKAYLKYDRYFWTCATRPNAPIFENTKHYVCETVKPAVECACAVKDYGAKKLADLNLYSTKEGEDKEN
ncbi:unnamed protein product, partial [Timema podura]|nr:unnamed protein product [Timema podura]